MIRTVALPLALWLFAALTSASIAGALEEQFDGANKLYEQGKFSEATSAYQQMLASGQSSAALYFNLGNAWFKSGQIGRAVDAYRRAERISPRDPDIRANLQFARNQVQGPTFRATWWQRSLRRLTLNEWTLLAAGCVWLLFLLMAAGQWKPAWKPSLRAYILLFLVSALCVCGCLGAALYQDRYAGTGIVNTREAILRQGPLDESQQLATLHDGAEVRIIDKKDNWLQVALDARRSGWIKRNELVLPGNQGFQQ